jgi:hypothetical protein
MMENALSVLDSLHMSSEKRQLNSTVIYFFQQSLSKGKFYHFVPLMVPASTPRRIGLTRHWVMLPLNQAARNGGPGLLEYSRSNGAGGL